jgi:hypothetical protein
MNHNSCSGSNFNRLKFLPFTRGFSSIFSLFLLLINFKTQLAIKD